jgi:hypothetical protein
MGVLALSSVAGCFDDVHSMLSCSSGAQCSVEHDEPPIGAAFRSASHAAGDVLFAEDFESLQLDMSWKEGAEYGQWNTVFTGFGTVGIEIDQTKVLMESPMAATMPGESHAALVVSIPTFGDLDLKVQMKTVMQLRTDSNSSSLDAASAPNPWEVAWLLWHYTDNVHFYYITLKTNGWELGKEDPNYNGNQRFLTSGPAGYTVGVWNTVRVRQVGNSITVFVDGAQLTSFVDDERPYTSGSIGLYTEDAYVRFDNITVSKPRK